MRLLDNALSQIKPRIPPASLSLEQRITVHDVSSVFVVRVEPSSPMLKPHMVDGEIPARLNGHSNRLESGDELRQLIGEIEVGALSFESIIRTAAGLKEIGAVRDLTFISRKILQDIQIFFHRKADVDPTFTETTDAYDLFFDSISCLQKLRDGTTSFVQIIDCNSQVAERFARFERAYRLAVGGFQL